MSSIQYILGTIGMVIIVFIIIFNIVCSCCNKPQSRYAELESNYEEI